VQLERQLGIARYDTAWLMLHKLPRAMVAPEREPLTGPVEVDDFYVGGIEEGRGGGRKPDLSAASLCGFVTEVVDADAVAHTDGWQGYRHLSLLGYEHCRSSQRQTPPGEWLLPRVHRSISNLKAWLHGTHRDVSREHLQVYLDEFVFRHNRQHTPMAALPTLLGLGAQRPPTTYRQITQHAA
jgi:hypothetical protein